MGLGFRVRVSGLGFRVSGLELWEKRGCRNPTIKVESGREKTAVSMHADIHIETQVHIYLRRYMQHTPRTPIDTRTLNRNSELHSPKLEP